MMSVCTNNNRSTTTQDKTKTFNTADRKGPHLVHDEDEGQPGLVENTEGEKHQLIRDYKTSFVKTVTMQSAADGRRHYPTTQCRGEIQALLTAGKTKAFVFLF